MTDEQQTIAVDAVVFREDLYPRIETSAVTVQRYAEDLTVLPPIEVNQHGELIDGWHRWTAHKKMSVDRVPVKVTQTSSDVELLELAILRNATHGLQLSQADKRDMARRIYAGTPERERDAAKRRLLTTLSVSERTLRSWLERLDKDAKEARERRIFDLWLSCHTQDEVAAATDTPQPTVHRSFIQFGNLADLNKSQQAAAEHVLDFEPPIYNIWKQQTKTDGSAHFGNTEVRWLDNLLYCYTKPFDVVMDPFAGGGSTIDLCKRRLRRYYVSDRKPIVERAHEIRKHDLATDGLPKPPQWQDVRLVYLDPPYWKQAEGRYSSDDTDLANMSLEAFNETLAGIVTGFAAKLTTGYIALVIQPTQWNAPGRQFTDHVGDMLRLVRRPVEMRYSAPYSTEQYTPQMVEWAKEHRRPLVLTREIVVWRVE